MSDSDPSGSYGEDIDNQSAGNYDYDYTGNLIRDNSEGITGIEWSVYGKIKQINKGSVTIGYGYDALGNRISKEVSGTGGGGDYKDFYIRDAQGNVMAIYRGRAGYVDWSEQVLYGSSRLGIWQYGKARPGVPPSVTYDSMMTGSTTYELTNHLGNVLTTISDKKVGHSSNGATVDYYRAVVLNQTNYYSGGMQMPVRRSDSLLFTNTFDAGTDGWAVYNVGTLQNDNGRLKFTGTVAWSTPKKALTLEEGRQYRIRFTIDMGNCSDLHVPVYKSDISSYVVMDGVGISVTASGSYEGTFTATSNNMLLLIEMIPGVNPPPGSAGYYWIDDVSLERLGPVDSIGVEYRYGFNGKELDRESPVQYDYGFRIYDPRLVRFKSVDPLAKSYPWYTPYQFAGNTPIQAIDLDGLEPKRAGKLESQQEQVRETTYDLRGVSNGTKIQDYIWHEGGLRTGRSVKDKNGKLIEEVTRSAWYSPDDYVKMLSGTLAAQELAAQAGYSWRIRSTALGFEELSGFIGNELNDNTARYLDAAALNAANAENFKVTGTIYSSGVNAEDLIGAGVLLKTGLKTIARMTTANLAAKGGSSWVYGTFKTGAKWASQFSKRGWTAEQVTEAVTKGKNFDAVNMVNKANGATRYVHPTTGQSVVIDNVTKELLHVGGPGFKY